MVIFMYDLENKLREAIKKFGEDVNIENINAETDLIKDFNYNSINIIELIIELEDIFEMEIDDNNLELFKLSQYSELLNMVREKVN